MPRTKDFDKQVEQGLARLLETVSAAEVTQAMTPGVEARLKVLAVAINFMKVKHKIDEGAAGSAFGGESPEEPV